MTTVLLVGAVAALWWWALRGWSWSRRTRRMIRAADEAMDLIDADQRERMMRHAMKMPPLHPESLTTALDDDEEDALAEIQEREKEALAEIMKRLKGVR